MTSNKEDYLKEIYEEGGLKDFVTNKILSQKLNIAPASVSEMLVRLQKEELIIYEPYKGAKLTKKGLNACISIMRSHRLWEVFLIRHLNYSWREAHEEAHLLEHVSPKRMIDRLEIFLDYPKTCPHGSFIPQSDGELYEESYTILLSDLVAGDKAFISRIVEDGKLLDYLEKNGLKLNEAIEMVMVDEYDGPLTFIQNNNKITISHKAASQVFVELIKE